MERIKDMKRFSFLSFRSRSLYNKDDFSSSKYLKLGFDFNTIEECVSKVFMKS